LAVNVTGAKSNTGNAVLAVFTSANNYLKQPVVSKTKPINEQGEAVFRLGTLSEGRYAISVYYDEDSNGELKTGLFGIPTELVGFYNNVKGIFGPPSYKKASFMHSKATEINIRLGNAKE